VRRNPTVVLDAAHNVASIAALIHTLSQSIAARRRWLIFATTRDKDVPGMLRLLLDAFDEVVLTCYHVNPRAVPPEELAALARSLSERSYRTFDDPHQAWRSVLDQAQPEDLVCVAGSFFLAAELGSELRSGGA
jgi:dihydrofolate synthase / folylpolyglutamate synthase